ncbi:hypothetical protein BpHYR1_045825 [Brachionus plicatilis]|uniref:Uncharacterized protein n=1 Tax=Brachionus plicatilis TaxID=10195 RepID=A0A3M7RR77_BRAPC|nr:hypothetical protein BpHYR1_045825 [Brachionus plicatilis]
MTLFTLSNALLASIAHAVSEIVIGLTLFTSVLLFSSSLIIGRILPTLKRIAVNSISDRVEPYLYSSFETSLKPLALPFVLSYYFLVNISLNTSIIQVKLTILGIIFFNPIKIKYLRLLFNFNEIKLHSFQLSIKSLTSKRFHDSPKNNKNKKLFSFVCLATVSKVLNIFVLALFTLRYLPRDDMETNEKMEANRMVLGKALAVDSVADWYGVI